MAIKTKFSKGCAGNICLDHLQARLIDGDAESKQWRELVVKHHYLHNANIIGPQRLYVIECGGKCVALLSFSISSWHLLQRDNWIGWNEIQRRRRISLVVQNSRFLIMPGVNTRNLASKSLSLCLNRLNDDWMREYGHPVLLVETFVDKAYPGTSYRADNWIRLGETQGFSRNGNAFYIANGAPKTLWVKPLRPDAVKLLSSPTLPPELACFERDLDMPTLTSQYAVNKLESLFDAFNSVTDLRASNTKYRLGASLAIITCGFMAGCEGLIECVEFAKHLSPAQKRALRCKFVRETREWDVPCHTTLWRAIGCIDPVELQRLVSEWYNSQAQKPPTAIAVDGKTMCGSLDPDGNAIHVVSAISHDPATPFFCRRPQTTKVAREKRAETSLSPSRNSTVPL